MKTLRQHLAATVLFVLLAHGAGAVPAVVACWTGTARAARCCCCCQSMAGAEVQCPMAVRGEKTSSRAACRMTCGAARLDSFWLSGPTGDMPPAGEPHVPPPSREVGLGVPRTPADIVLLPLFPPPKA